MTEFVIGITRSRLRGMLIGALGVGLGLGCSEVLARIFFPHPQTAHIRLDDVSGTAVADCYSRTAGATLPLDLERPEDRAKLLSRLHVVRVHWPPSVLGQGELEQLLVASPATNAVPLLARHTPLCTTYDLSPGEASPRRMVAPLGYDRTFALLGDSFAFGQGVADDETFAAKLANRLKARIRSYADAGADTREIRAQFQAAMTDSERLGFSKIIYLCDLSEPTSANRRLERLTESWPAARSLARVLRWFEDHSAFARALSNQIALHTTGEQVADWWNPNGPAKTPPLLRSFGDIARMSQEASRHGIGFVVFVYPLMLDMNHYPLIETHRALDRLSRTWGVELHDLLPAFRESDQKGGNTLWVHPMELHPNAYAHAIAARAAASYLNPTKSK